MIIIDISSFFGRFHPMIVHLPIGFIILALISEIRFFKLLKKSSLKQGSIFNQKNIWFLSFITSAFSAFLGWLLTQDGHYIESQIVFHQWSGILLVVLSGIGWILRKDYFIFPKAFIGINNLLTLILLVFVGHYGSILTHGELI